MHVWQCVIIIVTFHCCGPTAVPDKSSLSLCKPCQHLRLATPPPGSLICPLQTSVVVPCKFCCPPPIFSDPLQVSLGQPVMQRGRQSLQILQGPICMTWCQKLVGIGRYREGERGGGGSKTCRAQDLTRIWCRVKRHSRDCWRALSGCLIQSGWKSWCVFAELPPSLQLSELLAYPWDR